MYKYVLRLLKFTRSTDYNDGEISTCGEIRGSLSTDYNDGEISTCG